MSFSNAFRYALIAEWKYSPCLFYVGFRWIMSKSKWKKFPSLKLSWNLLFLSTFKIGFKSSHVFYDLWVELNKFTKKLSELEDWYKQFTFRRAYQFYPKELIQTRMVVIAFQFDLSVGFQVTKKYCGLWIKLIIFNVC